MAGSDSRFNATKFRDAIEFAMTMGLPPEESDRATFRWATVRTFDRPDPKGLPYNLNSTPATEDPHDDVQVPVAVQSPRAASSETFTNVGEFNDNKVVITILDTYYDQVNTANEVLLGGNVYRVDYWGPPLGLFDVQVYQVFLRARDES